MSTICVGTNDGAGAATAAPPSPTPGRVSTPDRIKASSFSGDVRTLAPVREPDPIMLPTRKKTPPSQKPQVGTSSAPTSAPSAPGAAPAASMPAPNTTFAGLHFAANGAGFPPDTNGDVGPNHYIQTVNSSVGIYTKTGTALATFTFNQLWATASSGTLCDTTNRGDPVVVYDAMADRWIVSDFAFSGSGSAVPFYECIAVSKTADPVSGGWWFYPIRADDASHAYLNDYPKLGVWPDGIYMSANEFDSTFNFKEVRLWALNRDDLYSGSALRQVVYDSNATTYFSLQPGNLRGTLPPSGTPGYFVAESQSAYQFQVFKMAVNWTSVTGVVSGPTLVSQTSYPFSTSDPVGPQPGTTTKLDTLRDRVMMQAQYRRIGATESLWVSHTVNNAPTGVQWAQIDVTGGVVATTPVQQQIFTNGADGQSRYMPSLAVDEAGNMAVGYTNSSSTVFPSISYAGRLSNDPLNTLPQGEATLFAGTRSQIFNCGGSPCDRWGDYTAMTPDPVQACTFWYTNEYYSSSVASVTDWQTRIGSFTMPQCVPVLPAIPDQNVVEGDAVTIAWTGADSAPSGHALSATLVQNSGPTPLFVQSSSATTRRFIAPRTTTAAGNTLKFTLTVTDTVTGTATTKDIVVNVSNFTPVATASTPTLAVTGQPMTLTGASVDPIEPDSAPAGTVGRLYSWSQTGGPATAITAGATFRNGSVTPGAPGTYTFGLTVTDHGGTGATSSSSSTTTEVRTPAAGGTLSGVVHTDTGTGLAGATVDVLGSPTGSPLASTTSTGSGAWSVSGLTNGINYWVRFSLAGYGTRWASDGIGATGVRPVIAPSPLVDAVLTANAQLRTITGTALNSAGGSAGAGLTVRLFDANGILTSTTTDAGGAYSFPGLTAKGKYSILIGVGSATLAPAFVTSDGLGAIAGNTGLPVLFVDTTAALSTAATPVRLYNKTTENRTITVTLQSAGAVPVTGAEVRIYGPAGYVTGTRTNTAGVYTFTGLRPGTNYKVWVWTKCVFCTSLSLTSQWAVGAPGEQFDQSGKLADVIDLTTTNAAMTMTLT